MTIKYNHRTGYNFVENASLACVCLFNIYNVIGFKFYIFYDAIL